MDAYIGVGTNLGRRREHLRAGLAGLGRAGRLVAVSSVWETEPVDAPDSDWFWNLVVRLSTELDPFRLLDRLLELERECGRERPSRNAPRPLDLDILLFGELRIDDERLELPHPRMWQRRFVLEPLAEIAPGLRRAETGESVREACRSIRDVSRARRLTELDPRKDLLL